MRVVLVSECYYPDIGGLPEHLHHLGGALSRRGHEVTILTTRFPDIEQALGQVGQPGGRAEPSPPSPPGVRVARLGRSCAPVISNGSVSRAAVGVGLGRAVAAELRRGVDVIHVHGPLFPTLPLLAIRHAPADAVLCATLHTHFPGSALLRLLRQPLQRYLDALDGVLAVSDSALRSVQAVGLRVQAEVVPNGVDLAYWGGGRPVAALRDGRRHVLVQARLEPRNDIGLMLAALGKVAEVPGLRGRLRLLVVGEGPGEAALRARVPPGVEVAFLGARVQGRADLAATAEVYGFSATIASHPVSLLEGLAAGLPVLCHDIEGARELVRDGVEGFVVQVGDVAGYAAALLRLLGDDELRRRMGAAGRRRAEAFSWERIAGQIEAFYEGCRRLRRLR